MTFVMTNDFCSLKFIHVSIFCICKVVHDAGRYYELSLIEAEILRDVNGAGGFGSTHCVSLLNFFKLEGHACMVRHGHNVEKERKRNI